ncbi:MAG: enoyl-CoA hydratase/isomerase family protein [Deltaproteobacteria bacterium]|nr:enoyl-CoA hydratase/isomerase family protein [Deltaproteobacteria bacterium]
MSDFKAIQYSLENDVAWVTMNRPEQRNAVNAEMREELIQVLTDAQTNAAVRAVVLTGSGKGFCTGADLSGPRGQGPTGAGATRLIMKSSSQRLIRALWDLEKPVVAAVNGVAAGLGSHLAFASDFVIAAADARFIEVFVRRGIAVDAAGAFLLPRLVGLQRAKQMVYFGDDLSAADAERFGLVSKIVPGDQLAATAREWAEKLAKGPTVAIGLSKRLLNRSLESDMETCLEEEALVQTVVSQSEDIKEGMTAFMERRPAQFKGR